MAEDVADDKGQTGDEAQPSAGAMSEAEIDYNVMGTFPASDPPSWTLGVSPHKRRRDEFEGEKRSAEDPTHQNEAAESDG